MGLLEERLRRPVHLGAVAGANAVGAVGNPACGDVVTVHLRIEAGRIAAAGFESLGSAYQLATASVLCDVVAGMPVEEARRQGPDVVLERLPGLPERYRYLARLAVEALHRALERGRGDGPADSPPDPEAAEAAVLALLADGRRRTTVEVQALLDAESVRLPASTLRFLNDLRRRGTIHGEMSERHRAWLWWA